MTQDEINEVFSGMEEVYRKEDEKFKAPMCHFTRMSYEASDYEEWFICHHCGHTKEIGMMDAPH